MRSEPLVSLYEILAEDCRTAQRLMAEGLASGRTTGLAVACVVDRHLALDPIDDPAMAKAVIALVNQEPIVDDPAFVEALEKLELGLRRRSDDSRISP